MTILGTIFTILGALAAMMGIVQNQSVAGQLMRAFGGPAPGTQLILIGVIGIIVGVIMIGVGLSKKESV